MLKNARQLATYAAVTPRIFQSGTSGNAASGPIETQRFTAAGESTQPT